MADTSRARSPEQLPAAYGRGEKYLFPMVWSRPVASSPTALPSPQRTRTMRTAVMTATMLAAAAGLTACTEEQAYCVDLAGYVASAAEVDPTNVADYPKILDD